MKAQIIEKYQCHFCSTWYADDDTYNDKEALDRWPHQALDAQEAAAACCAPEVGHGYFCSVCSKHFYRYTDAKEHMKERCTSSEVGPSEQYFDLLFEGLPPIKAWHESHRELSDDRRIIEEVLQL